jgi:hypothetical protein
LEAASLFNWQMLRGRNILPCYFDFGACLVLKVPLDDLDQLCIGRNAVLVMANAAVGEKIAAIADIGLILIGPLNGKFMVPREHCGPAFLGKVLRLHHSRST